MGQVIAASNGTLVAHFENDSPGNDVLAAVSLSAGNRYRFSTKYFDQETNLYYYGYRYYAPELGRWINRDPIGEDGGNNLYVSFLNAPTNTADYLGNEILSFQVKGDGASEVSKFNNSLWRNDLEIMYKDLGRGSNLGLHVGKGFQPTFISEFCRLYGWCGNKGKPRAIGLYKFEVVVNWCGNGGSENWPRFLHYISNLKVWRTNKLGEEKELFVDRPSEVQDGEMNYVTGISDELKNDDGTFKSLAYDAPRFSSLQFNDPARYRYYFEAEWRITAKDKNSLWESKIRLNFSFDDDGSPNIGDSSFSVISAPRRLSKNN